MSTKAVLANVNLNNVKRDYAWYTVVTLLNCEESYIRNLKDAVAGSEMENYVKEYYVPLQYVKDSRKLIDGSKKERIKKVRGDYSTYVFVKCILTSRMWNILRTTSGAAVVLTSGGYPSEVSEESIAKIRRQQAPINLTDSEVRRVTAETKALYECDVKKPVVSESEFNTDFTT